MGKGPAVLHKLENPSLDLQNMQGSRAQGHSPEISLLGGGGGEVYNSRVLEFTGKSA